MKSFLVSLLLFVSMAAHAASITLTWQQSTSPNIAFNTVYRAAVKGGPYTVVYAANAPTVQWEDDSIIGGQLYCYVVTATSTDGVESLYSNQACLSIATKPPFALKTTATP